MSNIIIKAATKITIENLPKKTRGYLYLFPAIDTNKKIRELVIGMMPITIAEDIYSNTQPFDHEIIKYFNKNKLNRFMLFHNTYTETNFLRLHQLYTINPYFKDFMMNESGIKYYKQISQEEGVSQWEEGQLTYVDKIKPSEEIEKNVEYLKSLGLFFAE